MDIKEFIENLSDNEKVFLERGKQHWMLNALDEYNGGYIKSETLKELILNVIENTWMNAHNFFTSEQNGLFNYFNNGFIINVRENPLLEKGKAILFVHPDNLKK